MSKDRGYIRLWRDIDRHWSHHTAQKRPATDREGMEDLFLMARGTDNGTLNRGELQVSTRYLAKYFNWSRKKVRVFLSKLEGSGAVEIVSKGDRINPMIIRICNYAKYNNSPSYKNGGPPKGPPKGPPRGPHEGPPLTKSDHILMQNEGPPEGPPKGPPKGPLKGPNKRRVKEGLKKGKRVNTICTERFQSESSAQSIDIGLPLPGDQGELFLTQAGFEEFQKLYPGVDVMQELRKMRAWLLSNPTRRKTARGMQRFVNSWLSRAQDNPSRAARQASKDDRSAQVLRDWISREDS